MADVPAIRAPEVSLSEGSTPGGLPTNTPTPGLPFYAACIRSSRVSPGTLQDVQDVLHFHSDFSTKEGGHHHPGYIKEVSERRKALPRLLNFIPHLKAP